MEMKKNLQNLLQNQWEGDEMKRLLKPGYYYVSIDKKILLGGFDVNYEGLFENFSDMISDFTKFSYLGIDIAGDLVYLTVLNPDDGPVFVKYPIIENQKQGRIFIKLNEVLKEDNEMDKAMNRELTLEERLEQLEKEKAELQLQIKNQEKYDIVRTAGDDLALAVKAMQDSGFDRAEAMDLIKLVLVNNMARAFMRI